MGLVCLHASYTKIIVNSGGVGTQSSDKNLNANATFNKGL